MLPISSLSLADIMDRDVLSVQRGCLLGDMVERMKGRHISHGVVLDGGSPVGMFTERDLVRLLHRRTSLLIPVDGLMSAPVSIVPATLEFRAAYAQLCLSRLRHLIVVDEGGAVVGVAAERDFLGHLGMELCKSVESLTDMVDRSVPSFSPTTPVAEAINHLVQQKRGCLLVEEGGKLVGLFTEHQAPTVLAHHEDGSDTTLAEVMHRGMRVLPESASVGEAITLLVQERIGYLVVVDTTGNPAGVIAQSRLLENVRASIHAEIAARQLMEEQVQVNEARLQATLDALPDLIFELDLEGRYHAYHAPRNELLAVPPQNFLGKTIAEVLPAPVAATCMEALHEANQSGHAEGRLISLELPQGLRWFELYVSRKADKGEGLPHFIVVSRDITERRAAEIKLRLSEERQRFAFGAARQSWFVAYVQTGAVETGPEYAEMLGYDPAAFSTSLQNWLDNIHPEDVGAVRQMLQKLLQTGGPTEAEYRLRTASGGWKWLHSTGAVVEWDAEGRPVRLSGIHMDITERKQTEQRLRESEVNFRTFFDTIDDYLFVLDSEANILHINRAVTEHLGYQEQELVGASILSVHPTDRREEVRQIVGEMLAGGRETCPIPLLCRDGRQIPVETRVVRGLWNGASALFGVSRDVSEQARIRESLREESEHRRQLLEEATEREFFWNESQQIGGLGGWRADPVSNTVMWTRGVYEIIERPLDYKPDLATALEAYLPDSRQRVVESLKHTLATGEPFSIEVQVRGAVSGQDKWTELRGMPHRDAGGRVDYLMGTLQDISSKKEIDRELRDSEARFRTLFESSPDPVWIIEGRRFVECNQAAVEILGYPSKHLLMNTHPSELSPKFQPNGEASYTKAERMMSLAQEKGMHRFEWVHTRYDRSDFYVEVTLSRIVLDGREAIYCVWRDISEQKRSEIKLAEGDARLRAIYEGAQDGILMADVLSRNFVEVNPSICTMLGYERDELLQMSALDIYFSNDLPRVIHEFEMQARGELSLASGVPLRRKDGSTIYADITFTQIRVGGNQYSVGFFRDVTERRAAERSLAENQKRLELALDSAHMGVWEFDFTQNRLYWSPEIYNAFGFAPFEPTREKLLAITHPDDVHVSATAMLAALQERRPYLAVYRVISGGKIVWVEDRGEIQFAPDGAPLKAVGTAQNITERQLAQEQLRKLAQAVEQSPESIIITDLEARIEYVNEAFVRNTGYSREEALGQNPRMLSSGKTPRSRYAALWEAMVGGQLWKGEFINCRKDGSELIDSAIVTPIRQADGRITHYVAIQGDITERVRLNEELDRHRHHLEQLVAERTSELVVAKAAAEAANVAKSAFLANMSHEIRTPLNAVLGMARIGVRESASGVMQARFQQIANSGSHLLGVINDILDFSKIEANKLLIEEQAFPLVALIEDLRLLMADQAAERGLAFSVEVSPELPHWVRGDALRLRQVLLNLLGNAFKFTEQGSVSVFVTAEEGYVVFQVCDTGIGMNESQIAQLFQPFQQADASTTRRFGGTGLGLVISRKLVQMMGGDIEVRSEVGVGSTFILYAPLREVSPPASQVVSSRIGDGQVNLAGIRVLAAEDVEVNRMVLQDMLELAGAQVAFAGNGQEAIDRVKERGADAFDVVLMDVQMPVMDGHQAARRLRELAPGLPVIGLTAHAMEEDRRKCLESGMVDHVTKPIDESQLYAAILKVAQPKARPEPVVPVATRETVAEAVPGGEINWDKLNERFRGRKAFIRKIGQTVIDTHAASPDKLRELAEAGMYADLAVLAHTLKGVMGNLSAEGAQHLAAAAEMAARKEESTAAVQARQLALKVAAVIGELEVFVRGDA